MNNTPAETAPVHLQPELLTKAGFAPYGDVIETTERASNQMNSGTFARFDNLATVATAPGSSEPSTISMVRSEQPCSLPYEFNLVEKHPLCSQAFIPRTDIVFYVVVGPAGEQIAATDLRAFVTNGRQGISYLPGTWHMPLIALAGQQEFLVIDQAALPGNLVERVLPQQVILQPAEPMPR